MVLKYKNYPDGIHHFSLKKKASSIGLDDKFTGDALLKITMDKSLHQIVFTCQASCNMRQECDRCMNEFDKTLETDFRLTYFFDKSETGNEQDDVHYINSEIDLIDFTDDTVQYLNLAVPMKTLCSEDCRGLCSGCGKNLNEEKCVCSGDVINPAWEKLLKLKGKLD